MKYAMPLRSVPQCLCGEIPLRPIYFLARNHKLSYAQTAGVRAATCVFAGVLLRFADEKQFQARARLPCLPAQPRQGLLGLRQSAAAMAQPAMSGV